MKLDDISKDWTPVERLLVIVWLTEQVQEFNTPSLDWPSIQAIHFLAVMSAEFLERNRKALAHVFSYRVSWDFGEGWQPELQAMRDRPGINTTQAYENRRSNKTAHAH